ncbi:hypothetical protein BH23CHL6_BH23CHL6_11140 [soil metagenome]
MHRQRLFLPLVAPVILALVLAPVVAAHDDHILDAYDPSQPLLEHDLMTADVVSAGPSGKKIKNLSLRGRGERLTANATTDVWAHEGFAYTGTFNSPCGGEPGAGVWVWNVKNKNSPSFVGVIESETGSRSNDVKVATMNSGDVLVHSNENCGPGGMGGFEVYNVDDPANPVHLATVRVHEANETLRTVFGGVNRGVHNLFLFTQGERDFVAMQTHAWFGGLQIFELTNPTNPQLVSAWGAELLCEEAYCSTDPYNETDIPTLIDHINGFMFCLLTPCFGSSQNRFLHDVTITTDGTLAYLSHWDAGLILLDISDPADPVYISTALDPANGSLDGEVNSHAAWPSEDGKIVVETEEDFAAWVTVRPPGNLTFGAGDPAAPLPGVAVATATGGDFEASQTGNAGTVDADSLEVTSGPLAGNVYPAIELGGDQPRFADTGPISGNIVWIGQACNADPILNAGAFAEGGIAVARRGGCTFREKNFNAAAAGADAIVIANNLTNNTPWGGIRIWDYSDPENPVLASTFNTVCSASPEPIPECDPLGTYSVHNVIVESTGKQVKAYVSWYFDGMLILDVTDPYNPREIARYFDNSAKFLASNGGQPHDFWGVGKVPNSPWVYGSDRNGGLYVFKEQGSGSGK